MGKQSVSNQQLQMLRDIRDGNEIWRRGKRTWESLCARQWVDGGLGGPGHLTGPRLTTTGAAALEQEEARRHQPGRARLHSQ